MISSGQENRVFNRVDGLDILKCLCAFLVICIHVPFPEYINFWILPLTRVAVPIFFMITGYFYIDVINKKKENRQIKNVLLITVFANVLYFLWNFLLCIINGTYVEYLSSVFSVRALTNFIFFNESPFGYHLWYLSALLYTLVVYKIFIKINYVKVVLCLCPFLLAMDLILGKYSLLLFGREFSYLLVRNWLFVGIPYVALGMLIRRFAVSLNRISDALLLFSIVSFSGLTLLEKFLLIYFDANAIRDHYINTTFLACAVFVYFVKCTEKSSFVLRVGRYIGRKNTLGIYIIHPMIITILEIVSVKMNVNFINILNPIIVFILSVISINIIISLYNQMFQGIHDNS